MSSNRGLSDSKTHAPNLTTLQHCPAHFSLLAPKQVGLLPPLKRIHAHSYSNSLFVLNPLLRDVFPSHPYKLGANRAFLMRLSLTTVCS